MAASITTDLLIPVSARTTTVLQVRPAHRRRITPQAGHALEILGHAIEYLTDEFVHEGASFSAENERVQAVQLLMALNRQVYFECPEVPSLRDRCRAILHC
jgi:hypothetical protein